MKRRPQRTRMIVCSHCGKATPYRPDKIKAERFGPLRNHTAISLADEVFRVGAVMGVADVVRAGYALKRWPLEVSEIKRCIRAMKMAFRVTHPDEFVRVSRTRYRRVKGPGVREQEGQP